MFNFSRALVRQSQSALGLFSLSARGSNYSTPAAAELKPNTALANDPIGERQQPIAKKTIVKGSSSIVAAAFASLSNDTLESDTSTPFTDGRIKNAKSVDDLLEISTGAGISRRHALKVVSVLADWTASGKVQLPDFESDVRFIKLCKVLSKSNAASRSATKLITTKSEDLSMIINVAADDEAAKLIASITFPQMVTVMQTLAAKKRRSTMLLRALSFNITKSAHTLDLKQSADLLYSMCILNFPDANLLGKISNDIQVGFDACIKKSSVIGSIVTSLGLLKYKDTNDILDIFCKWTMENVASCRSQDIFALFLTLAVLNHQPANAKELYSGLIPQLTVQDAQRASIWLDFVWSLVVLNQSTQAHVDSVLNPEFVETCQSMSSKLKLLQINAANANAKTKLPDESDLMNTQISRPAEKEEMVNSVLDTLKNLMKRDTYFTSCINTQMGFLIDAECIIDKKCMPVVRTQFSPTQHRKVAILVLDYHDMSRGRVELLGMSILQKRLLEQKGYNVIFVPFYEYRVRDKLIHRVQLIESKLRALGASTP